MFVKPLPSPIYVPNDAVDVAEPDILVDPVIIILGVVPS